MTLNRREVSKLSGDLIDANTKSFVIQMCKNCNFYKGNCIKKRTIRECSEKGLKNKD